MATKTKKDPEPQPVPDQPQAPAYNPAHRSRQDGRGATRGSRRAARRAPGRLRLPDPREPMTLARVEYATAQATFVTPRGRLVDFAYRLDTSDWNTISSVMQPHDEYGLAGIRASGLALDVGAHIGAVTIALAMDNPELHVIAVEAIGENATLARENVERNGLGDRVNVMHLAAAAPDIESTSVMWRGQGSENAEHHAFIGNSDPRLRQPGTAHETETDRLRVARDAPGTRLLLGSSRSTARAASGASSLIPPSPGFVERIVGEWHPTGGHVQRDIRDVLADTHDVTFTGPVGGPGGFVARATRPVDEHRPPARPLDRGARPAQALVGPGLRRVQHRRLHRPGAPPRRQAPGAARGAVPPRAQSGGGCARHGGQPRRRQAPHPRPHPRLGGRRDRPPLRAHLDRARVGPAAREAGDLADRRPERRVQRAAHGAAPSAGVGDRPLLAQGAEHPGLRRGRCPDPLLQGPGRLGRLDRRVAGRRELHPRPRPARAVHEPPLLGAGHPRLPRMAFGPGSEAIGGPGGLPTTRCGPPCAGLGPTSTPAPSPPATPSA
jgi:FkbM family methyltransferase